MVNEPPHNVHVIFHRVDSAERVLESFTETCFDEFLTVVQGAVFTSLGACSLPARAWLAANRRLIHDSHLEKIQSLLRHHGL